MKDSEQQKNEISIWLLRRKVEAGIITANGLEQLDKARHACNVVQHVVEDLKKVTTLLAEATKLPQSSRMICEAHGEKYDKQLLRDLEEADSISKNAVMFLLQVTDLILDADIKLKSTGWLSDYPPVDSNKSTVILEKEATPEEILPVQEVKSDSVQNCVKEHSTDGKLESLQEELENIRRQKKNLKKKMLARKKSDHMSDNEKAEQKRIDESKLNELNRMIQQLVEDIKKLIALNDARAIPPNTGNIAELYRRATLRDNPADDCIPDKIGVFANF